jgi:quercetin dioxygenase-like cupin family protein
LEAFSGISTVGATGRNSRSASSSRTYTIRVKLPSGVKLMPHRHPEDRVYSVISGVFYIGLGEQFDAENLKAYPPGSVVVLPGDNWHFH